MYSQDVTGMGPVAERERGLLLFLPPTLSRGDTGTCQAETGHCAGGDLMFFLTRSHRTLTYSDGGD